MRQGDVSLWPDPRGIKMQSSPIIVAMKVQQSRGKRLKFVVLMLGRMTVPSPAVVKPLPHQLEASSGLGTVQTLSSKHSNAVQAQHRLKE